jgi:hypothetical protein
MEHSLGAELLMLAIDPKDGGLLPHNRSRLLKALAAAEDGGRTGRIAGVRARRLAMRELEAAGLVHDAGVARRMRLTDPAAGRRRFAHLARALTENEVEHARDRELLVLLAWAGLLAGRLSKGERRLAARRLRAWGQETGGVWQPEGSAPQAIPDAYGAVAALGGIAALAVAAHDGFGSLDSGGAAHHVGGHDAGGGHHGGGHHGG